MKHLRNSIRTYGSHQNPYICMPMCMQMICLVDIIDEGTTVKENLGVKIDHRKDESFRMYQPHLMQRIIEAIPGMENANEHLIPVSASITLTADKHGPDRKETWDYRSVI
eukprot:8006196-Ditylum_brightwellii.AAC.1